MKVELLKQAELKLEAEVGDIILSKFTGLYYYIIRDIRGRFKMVNILDNSSSPSYETIEELIKEKLCGNEYSIIKSDRFKLVIY